MTQLDAQLCAALTDVPAGSQTYKGYVARALKELLQGLYDGDTTSPDRLQRTLNLPLHQVERMPVSFATAEAAAHVRLAWLISEIAEEVIRFSPRRAVSDIERQALEILRDCAPKVLLVDGVLERWKGKPPVRETLALALENAHDHNAVARLEGPRGPVFKISRLGRAVLQHLERQQPSQASSK